MAFALAITATSPRKSCQLNYNVDAIIISVEYLEVTLRYDGATDAFAGTIDWREETPDGTRVLAAAPAYPITGTPVRVTL